MINAASPDQADLGFLCDRAQSLLDQQISGFDQIRQNSGVLLTLLTVFLPFFLSAVDDSVIWVQWATILPTMLIISAVLLFLGVFGSQPLDRGMSLAKYNDLICLSHEDCLLHILGGIRSSFDGNKKALSPIQKKYRIALFITKSAVIFSASTLVINKFVRPPEHISHVYITNPPSDVRQATKATGNTEHTYTRPRENREKQSKPSK